MRQYKFRGKEIKTGDWVYGYFTRKKQRHAKTGVTLDSFINTEQNIRYDIDINTVGQYTGLKDKYKVEIFDSDLCKDSAGAIVQILWAKHHQWGCKVVKGGVLSAGITFPLWHWDKCEGNGMRELEVIGNIFDNPELMGGGQLDP